MARPRKEIDEEQLKKLAKFHCTIEEIAAFFNVSRDTIERRYAAKIIEGRNAGKAKLRDLQWLAAEGGNVQMLIWLGKVYLNQSETIHTQNTIINREEQIQSDKELVDKLTKDKV